MAVRKSSTLVLAEQIYSTSGVVSVGLRPCSRPVNIYLTVFQDSRRVDIFLSEIPIDYFAPMRSKSRRQRWSTSGQLRIQQWQTKKARVESRISHVVERRCFRVAQVD